MPRKRCAIECHEYQAGLGAGDQQCCIVQAEPRSVLPPRDVDDRTISGDSLAGGDESMRRILVSQ
jgi:hypothetical protein